MLKLPDRLQLSEELITNYKHKYCPYLGRTLVREKSEKLWSESIKSKSEKTFSKILLLQESKVFSCIRCHIKIQRIT